MTDDSDSLGDHAVDVAAVAALAALAWSPTAQVGVLAGAISSVAVGKRYLARRKA
jgi:hypothetical protein